VFVAFYLPGHRGGGPVRSIANLVEALGGEFDFRIVTFDRDVGDTRAYPHVTPLTWMPVGKAQVCYLPRGPRGAWKIARLLYRTRADVIYLNSFFSFMFSILPVLLMALAPFCVWPTVLAPRGEFSPGALQFKALKKAIFLALVRWLGLFHRSHFIFQASSALEADDIIREMSARAHTVLAAPFAIPYGSTETMLYPRVVTAVDLAAGRGARMPQPVPKTKLAGSLRVTWISRIVRKKNLSGALDYLTQVRGNVLFTIYGPLEDRRYWEECQLLIDALPSNIRVTYAGELPHADVVTVLEDHHVFLFPTHGENYGHVISEALTAGCAVIISDRTPWHDVVAERAGWALSLEDRSGFISALQQCVDMDARTFAALSARARAFGERHRNSSVPIEQHRQLFAAAVSWSMGLSS